ncbi:LysR family transcriptional regulator [Cupriavidus consociatus]|uniref:LysR family transcriptional regulator n=1 Tax=Cupriavidus consociatus TaxID=2821357 RepID=UPI001AE16F38|nr:MULTISPECIES: LysR family transcriptional regulator [unclassified Cupriavidus]MBP0623378.1 LysR family transcriptional regulator [Cupriavidus sp. LEh25]MDK2660076.1 LysR family transcriptional regulator [Cupriavidus sp. LEh21]
MKNFASLTQINVFLRIAELGSLSAAAKELNLSPSAVSKSLAQLEERLGVLLVKRTTRSLTLTDSGRIIVQRANDILSDLETTMDAARQIRNPEGNLRITCSMAFGSKQLTPIVGRYLDDQPKVSASIALDDRLSNLAEENYDLAVRITSRTDCGYAARKLATIHWVYCAAPGYLDAHESIHEPADLVQHRCLVYPAMTLNGAWSFLGERDTKQIAIKTALESNSSMALREAAIHGQGVACLPTYLVSSDIIQGALMIVVPQYRSAIAHTLYAMYYRSKYANALVRSFIDFVVDDIGRMPPWDRALREAVDLPRFCDEMA